MLHRYSKLEFLVIRSLFILGMLVTPVFSPVMASDMTANRDGRGLGLSFGANSGITGYLGMNSTDFVQAVVAINRFNNTSLSVDYARRVQAGSQRDLDLYYGAGLSFGNSPYYWGHRYDRWENRTYLGVRMPLGVLYWFSNIPLQLALEIAPTYVIIDGAFVVLDISLAIRYFF